MLAGIFAIASEMIAAIVSIFGGEVAIGVAITLAIKKILTFLVMVAIPVILFNVSLKYGSEFLQYMLTKITAFTGGTPAMVNLSGVSAWLADQLYLPQAMAILLAAVAVRLQFTLLMGIAKRI